MKCKLIVNSDSGNADKTDTDKLLKRLGMTADIETIDCCSNWNADGYDTVIVCGGDGTLHNALEKCLDKRLIYVPCGTLNETAKTQQTIDSVGRVNEGYFAYVCAAGSFTQIGYCAQNRHKKVWKFLAYLPQIFSSYRCHEIEAKLDVDGKKEQGKYTLLMVLKSHRCFGFEFNPDYKKTHKTYLLTVASPGKDCLKNRIKIFFPIFRIFFCKTRPKTTAKWSLAPFDKLTVELKQPQDFCFDGEKRQMQGVLHFSTQVLEKPVAVVKSTFDDRKKPVFLRKKCTKKAGTKPAFSM